MFVLGLLRIGGIPQGFGGEKSFSKKEWRYREAYRKV